MKRIYAVISLLVLGTLSGAQLQSSMERLCSRERVTFTCTIPSDGHQWDISSLNISRSLLPRDQGGMISDPPFQFTVTEVMTGHITSTATVTVTADLNGTLVVCRDGIGMLPDQISTINITGPPSVPTLFCADLSEDVSESVNVTVSWTLSGGDSADFYLISITTNAPQTPYGGLLNITTASVTQYELTGFIAGYEYNITVRGVNCASLVGRESEPLKIQPQVPAVPSSCNITLSYDQSSRRLLFINSTWDTVPDPVDPCPGISGNITQYQIRFQTGSVVATENVNIARCTAGRCSHTLEPPSNPPSSYDSVSVAAANVVGVGAARTCTTQTISTLNNLLTGVLIGVSSPTDARINCTFLFGFTGSAHCTVQYGNDSFYMNLPYSAESTETGTAGDTVSVVLRERLNSSIMYYYTVSAANGDVTVIVEGNFTTPQYSCSLMELWDLSAAGVNFLSDVSSLNDSAAQYPSCGDDSIGSAVLVNTTLNTATVAYYTGTTAGSTACFICDEGYELNTATNERVCQRNGLWSGNPIVCECKRPPWTIALFVMSILALLTTVVGVTVTIIDGITACCIQLSKKNLKIGDCCSDTKKETGMDNTNSCWHILVVTATIFLVIGVILWITVGVVVSNPPNGNACDPSWRSTRDGLIGSAFGASFAAFLFDAAMVWTHIYYHKDSIKNKRYLTVLLVIASIFSITGVGFWIASAVLLYIHDPLHCLKDETNGDEEGQTQTDRSGQNLELQESRVDLVKEKEKKPTGTVTQGEETAEFIDEEASKQSEQIKVSPGLMYAVVGPQIPPASVMPPASDSMVPYTSVIHVQSRDEDPTGTLSINVDTTSLSHSPVDTEGYRPPPIPPKQFLADDFLQSPKLLENDEGSPPPPIPPQQFSADDVHQSPESSEPQQSERNAPPPRPPKTNQKDTLPPPRPPKSHQQTAESRKKEDTESVIQLQESTTL